MSDINKELEQFFADARREVTDYLADIGQRAVDANIAEGDYRNRTGNLRRSNYFVADGDGLVVGNSASYASEVESRGYNVVDSGTKLIMEEIG